MSFLTVNGNKFTRKLLVLLVLLITKNFHVIVVLFVKEITPDGMRAINSIALSNVARLY